MKMDLRKIQCQLAALLNLIGIGTDQRLRLSRIFLAEGIKKSHFMHHVCARPKLYQLVIGTLPLHHDLFCTGRLTI